MKQLSFGKISTMTTTSDISKSIQTSGSSNGRICPSTDEDFGYSGQGAILIRLGDMGQSTFTVGGGYNVP